MVVMMVPALTGRVEVAQAAAKRFDFLLVSVLLPLGQFQRLQHQIHVFQSAAEGLDDAADLVYRL
jgi:hypothetical protein